MRQNGPTRRSQLGVLRIGLRRGLLASGIDADASAWRTAVLANSGTVSASAFKAVNRFVRSAKANGYWSKINRINLFCGDQLAAALVPLKRGSGGATDTNVNFVAGDYTQATGLTGGATKYLKTGLVPSVSLTLNDTHLAVYNRAANATGGGCMIGSESDGTVNYFSLFFPYTDGLEYSQAYNAAAGQVGGAVAAPYGMGVASRTSATVHAVYKRGTSVATSATNGGGLPTNEISVFGRYTGLAAALSTTHTLAMYSIGSGLSAAEDTAYNADIEAFQAALGRSV